MSIGGSSHGNADWMSCWEYNDATDEGEDENIFGRSTKRWQHNGTYVAKQTSKRYVTALYGTEKTSTI